MEVAAAYPAQDTRVLRRDGYDLIVSFLIEYKIFDVDKVNQALYEYNQPLLGG